MNKEEGADIVRKELLGLGICSKCKKDTPKEELAYLLVCDKCWEGLDGREKMGALYPSPKGAGVLTGKEKP